MKYILPEKIVELLEGHGVAVRRVGPLDAFVPEDCDFSRRELVAINNQQENRLVPSLVCRLIVEIDIEAELDNVGAGPRFRTDCDPGDEQPKKPLTAKNLQVLVDQTKDAMREAYQSETPLYKQLLDKAIKSRRR